MTKKDKKGNVVYRKIEMWYEYDDRNNCIFQKNSNGYMAWWEFDDQNRKISYKNSKGINEKYDWNKELPEKAPIAWNGADFGVGTVDWIDDDWVMLEDINGTVGGIK
tara:strand:- start:342 stop:662 length:321 start_codon:yes stop_codon:yes gene_type:complete